MTNLKKFFGLCINMGLVRKKNVADYWSKSRPATYVPFFATVMSFRLFAFISRVLHAGDPDAPVRGQDGFEPWSKVRPVLDAANLAFKIHYVPPQHVSIDESMVGMKNRVAYIQYMPNKRHCRFGIKKFEVCDSVSGYVMHVELYAGKDFPIRSDHGQAHGVVMDLMRKSNLLHKGYHLFTDNFYTKPALARALGNASTLLTGTVRANSRGLPTLPRKLAVGDVLNFRQDDLLCMAFREKKSQRKPVLMLSTSEAAGMVNVRTAAGIVKRKPLCIAAYNRYMGGVDLSDRKVYHVAAERSSRRYWKKIFFNIMDLSLLNAYELYRSNTDHPVSRYDFMCDVVLGLCASGAAAAVPDMQHCLQHLPGKRERECVVCSDRARGIRKRSSFCCAACGDGVHRECFHLMQHKRLRV